MCVSGGGVQERVPQHAPWGNRTSWRGVLSLFEVGSVVFTAVRAKLVFMQASRDSAFPICCPPLGALWIQVHGTHAHPAFMAFTSLEHRHCSLIFSIVALVVESYVVVLIFISLISTDIYFMCILEFVISLENYLFKYFCSVCVGVYIYKCIYVLWTFIEGRDSRVSSVLGFCFPCGL